MLQGATISSGTKQPTDPDRGKKEVVVKRCDEQDGKPVICSGFDQSN